MANKKDKCEKELEHIRARHGGTLKPEDVVEFARNKKTALHERFVWDDTEAARRYRLWQARTIIAHVTIIPFEGADRLVRAYVSLPEDRGPSGEYRTLSSVLTNFDRRESMLKQALAELKWFKNKYSALKEAAAIEPALLLIEKALREIARNNVA